MEIVRYEPAFNLARPEPQPPVFGLGDIVRFLLRRAPVILAVGAAAAIVALLVLMSQPPVYQASATLLIDTRQERVVDESQSLTTEAPSSAQVDSEIEILRSRRLAERLVDELDLMRDPHWNPALGAPSVMGKAKAWVKGLFAAEGASTADSQANARRAVIDAVANSISVRRRALSYVIEVRVEAGDAEAAARMANTLVSLYMRADTATRAEAGQQASGWLTERLQDLRADLEAKEAAAEEYRAQAGLLTPEGVLLSERQLIDLQTEIMAARADLAAKQARRRNLANLVGAGGSADSVEGVLSSDTIRELRRQEAEAAREQAERETTLGDRHPAVIKGRAELADVREQIRAETARISANFGNEVEVAQAKLGNLQGSLNAARGQLASDNNALVRLRELEREAAAARRVYESFLERHYEIADQGRLGATNARLISPADAPASPVSPRFSFAVLLAVALGGLLGLGAGLIAEFSDDRLRSLDQVARAAGVRSVVSAPRLRKRDLRMLEAADRNPPGYLVEEPMSPFAEAFRIARSWIASPARRGAAGRVIAATSAAEGEGKTTAALCLARIAAMSGQRVLLIDCNLRASALNDVLDVQPEVGLQQVLAGQREWRTVVGGDEASGAHVMLLAEEKFVGDDVMRNGQMNRLLEELREHYDLVVLDCAPLLTASESALAAGMADGVLLVVRKGATLGRDLRTAVKLLHASNAELVGVVVNFADAKDAKQLVAQEVILGAEQREFQVA